MKLPDYLLAEIHAKWGPWCEIEVVAKAYYPRRGATVIADIKMLVSLEDRAERFEAQDLEELVGQVRARAR